VPERRRRAALRDVRERRVRREDLGHPEVEDLDPLEGRAGLRQHDVAGFQIAVDHADGVRVRQRLEDLHRELDGPPHGQRPARLERLPQRRAVDELHDHEDQAVGVFAVVVQPDDARVRQRRDGLRLAEEAAALRRGLIAVVVRDERLGADELQRDDAAEGLLHGAIDGPHAPATEQTDDGITPPDDAPEQGVTADAAARRRARRSDGHLGEQTHRHGVDGAPLPEPPGGRCAAARTHEGVCGGGAQRRAVGVRGRGGAHGPALRAPQHASAARRAPP
jgi:hypothetical protein